MPRLIHETVTLAGEGALAPKTVLQQGGTPSTQGPPSKLHTRVHFHTVHQGSIHSAAPRRDIQHVSGAFSKESPILVSELTHGIWQLCAITAFWRLSCFHEEHREKISTVDENSPS